MRHPVFSIIRRVIRCRGYPEQWERPRGQGGKQVSDTQTYSFSLSYTVPTSPPVPLVRFLSLDRRANVSTYGDVSAYSVSCIGLGRAPKGQLSGSVLGRETGDKDGIRANILE